MPEPTPAERDVNGRELAGRGVPSQQGNSGTYLGEVEVDGTRYAKFGAAEGTWVSSSMKSMGYDRDFGPKDGYGAYRGMVLDANGKPLSDPDRIRPGQEFLIPERRADVAVPPDAVAPPPAPVPVPAPVPAPVSESTVAPAPAPRTSPAGERPRPPRQPQRSPRSTPPAEAAPQRLGLRPAPPEPLDPRDLEGTVQEDDREIDRLLADDSAREILVEELRWFAMEGIEAAMAGRAEQEGFGSGDNAVYSYTNDWVSNRLAPHISAWHNSAMFFRRMLEQAESGDLDGAFHSGHNGAASLADTQAEWNEYSGANLRLGAVMQGTVDEIRRTGVVTNLKLAGMGVGGEVSGVGERLAAFVTGIIGYLYRPAEGVSQLGRSLYNVVRVVVELAREYGKAPADFMPKLINLLSHQSDDFIERLSKMTPEEQSWESARLFGHLEGNLLPAVIGASIGGSLVESSAAQGLGGLEFSAASRGLGFATEGVATVGGAAVVADAATETARLAGFLSVFAVAVGSGPTSEGEVGGFSELSGRGRVGDLQMHEVIPHSLLEDMGLTTRRGLGEASRLNPSIALSQKVHAVVGRYQRALGVMFRKQRVGLTPAKIIELNIKALQYAGVPRGVVRKITRQVMDHSTKFNIK